MEIRELTVADLIAYRSEIIRFIYDNLSINLPYINDKEAIAEEKYQDIVRFKEDGSAILYGAIEESLVGFLWAYERNLFGERRLHLEHLIVDSCMRTKGIGSRLIENLYHVASNKNIKKIELMTTASNVRAVNFYEKNGYKVQRVQMEVCLEDSNED